MLYVMYCCGFCFLSISFAPLTHILITLQYFLLLALPSSSLIIKHTYLNKKRPCIKHSLALMSSTGPHQKRGVRGLVWTSWQGHALARYHYCDITSYICASFSLLAKVSSVRVIFLNLNRALFKLHYCFVPSLNNSYIA